MRRPAAVVNGWPWGLGACGETTGPDHEQADGCRIIVEHGQAGGDDQFVSLQIKSLKNLIHQYLFGLARGKLQHVDSGRQMCKRNLVSARDEIKMHRLATNYII